MESEELKKSNENGVDSSTPEGNKTGTFLADIGGKLDDLEQKISAEIRTRFFLVQGARK